jgi:hypothetical protein
MSWNDTPPARNRCADDYVMLRGIFMPGVHQEQPTTTDVFKKVRETWRKTAKKRI